MPDDERKTRDSTRDHHVIQDAETYKKELTYLIG